MVKRVVSRNISDAIDKSVKEVIDSGIDITELTDAVIDEKKIIKPNNKLNEKDLNELVELKSKGSAIPGQSLTNSPDSPYSWEKPPKFSNPREALQNAVTEILQPEAVDNVIRSLSQGMSVSDITSAVVFAKFFKGDVNPDVMMLMYEPLMYAIMGIGEQAGIDYNIDTNDVDEEPENEVKENIDNFQTAFEKIKNSSPVKRVAKEKITSGILPRSLLQKIEEKGPEIKSLLSKQEEKV